MTYFGTRSAWGRLLLGLTWILGCSRTGLEFDEPSTNAGSGGQASTSLPPSTGGAGLAETAVVPPFVPDPPPETFSRRWMAIHTESPSGAGELFALRLGVTAVEDVVRLDSGEPGQTWVGGVFSPQARGFAVEAQFGNQWRATRLVDFDANPPQVIDLPVAQSGRVTRFGPWLDDHRIVAYETDGGAQSVRAQDCRIIDLDAPDDVWSFPALGALGSQYLTYLQASPLRVWLAALVADDSGASSLLLAQVLPSGLGAWTKVITFVDGNGPARLNFSGDEGYLVVETYGVVMDELQSRLYPVRLSDPPIALPPYDAVAGDRHNYVMLAPTGARFFDYCSRTLPDKNGTNPITVVDAESGAKLEVTPERYSGYSPGFTQDGLGILSYAYSYYEDHGMEWFGVSSELVGSAPKPLINGAGLGTRGGSWSPDGAWFGISGSIDSDFAKRQGPVDLERFDFAPGYLGPTHLSRLSEYANVDNWLFAPDASSLVFRVAVTSSVFEASDPLTQGHFTSELGTYYVAIQKDAAPIHLDIVWTGFDSLTWLPDSQGLLRFGPVGTTNVVSDAHYGNGTSVNYANYSAKELDWLRLDGGAGIALDLSPYLGSEHLLSSNSGPIVPSSWGAQR